MGELTWTNERRKLSDLKPWPRNPRKIREDQARRLNESLDDFGQVDIIAIGPEGEVYNGHQRINVWAAEHGPDFEVDVRVASRALTEKERERLTILLHKGAAGEFDFDVLANEFDLDELLEWGFTEWDLQIAPTDDEWADALGGLPEGDRAPFQQMTFTLHDDQAELVKEALGASKAMGAFVDSPNENSNGNALTRICEVFLGGC